MPQAAWSATRERQYEHIKANEKARGRPESTAERIAAATVNRTRTAEGETKDQKPAGAGQGPRRAASSASRRAAAKSRGGMRQPAR